MTKVPGPDQENCKSPSIASKGKKIFFGAISLLLLGIILVMVYILNPKKELLPPPQKTPMFVKKLHEKPVLKIQKPDNTQRAGAPPSLMVKKQAEKPLPQKTETSKINTWKAPSLSKKKNADKIEGTISAMANKIKEKQALAKKAHPARSTCEIKPFTVDPKNLRGQNFLGMEFVYIFAGTFMMGTPPEQTVKDTDEPYQEVTLSNDFFIQTTEVTRKQWHAVMGKTLPPILKPPFFSDCGDDCPIENVSWNDAQTFIRKLNEKEDSKKYRLPTEAEWEYACRAGSDAYFCFGDNFDNIGEFGWYRDNSNNRVHPVGLKKTNAWGLYDMHGNVWEWCQDSKVKSPSSPVTDPTGAKKGTHRVCRGGSWRNYDGGVRCAYRDYVAVDRGDNFLGFRVARQP